MTETLHSDRLSDFPSLDRDHPVRVPDTSMLPGSEVAPPAAVGLLKKAVQGAHDTIDRLAHTAAPTVQQMGEGVAAAGETLHAKADQLRGSTGQWAESARSTVRGNPLAAVAAALALGAVIARVMRTTR